MRGHPETFPRTPHTAKGKHRSRGGGADAGFGESRSAGRRFANFGAVETTLVAYLASGFLAWPLFIDSSKTTEDVVTGRTNFDAPCFGVFKYVHNALMQARFDHLKCSQKQFLGQIVAFLAYNGRSIEIAVVIQCRPQLYQLFCILAAAKSPEPHNRLVFGNKDLV